MDGHLEALALTTTMRVLGTDDIGNTRKHDTNMPAHLVAYPLGVEIASLPRPKNPNETMQQAN